MKELIWLGTSYERLKEFPQAARKQAGFELNQVQKGILPSDWKTMSIIGSGVMEIRIHELNEYRVFYVAIFPEGVYVLHAFLKKTQTTLKRDLRIAKVVYASIKKTK